MIGWAGLGNEILSKRMVFIFLPYYNRFSEIPCLKIYSHGDMLKPRYSSDYDKVLTILKAVLVCFAFDPSATGHLIPTAASLASS